jgi:hypothetical protein
MVTLVHFLSICNNFQKLSAFKFLPLSTGNGLSFLKRFHFKKLMLSVLYTEGWVCDVALIEYTLGLGETQEGLGFWEGGYKGPMGDKGS